MKKGMTEAACYIRIYGYENFKHVEHYNFIGFYTGWIFMRAGKITPRLTI